jgi:hypothetical protein
MTSQRMSSVLTATASLLAVAAVGACGSSAPVAGSAPTTTATGTSSSTTSSTPLPTTVTVTTTVTASPTSRTPHIDPSPTTPPPGKDAPAIPRSAQDYGTAFVKAWVDGDRSRATLLGTESAVKSAFASSADAMPRFVRCEGAAGSSYCTWAGDEHTIQLRLGNETASLGQPDAVNEVVFRH